MINTIMKILEIISEGGNVFAGKTAPINIDNIDSTLARYFAELKRLFPAKAGIFDESHFVALGSVRKKQESGDIDLGVSALDILDEKMSDKSIKSWGIDPGAVAREAEALQRRARTSRPEQSRMKAFLKLLVVHINAKAPLLHCDEAKVSAGNIFGLFPQFNEKGKNLGIGVQIDWMIGNLEWLKFSYYSSSYPKGSNVKGLHRTQLLLAAFQVANLSFNHVDGVKDKETGKIVATSPESALKVLSKHLGFKITLSDTQDYYKLHRLFKANMKPAQYNALLNIYLKILDSTRADIPDDLHTEWRNRAPELGLKGKFLPDDSLLRNRS